MTASPADLERQRSAYVRKVRMLTDDIAEGIRVLVQQGVPLTEVQVLDRARNIASGILGNYSIEPLD